MNGKVLWLARSVEWCFFNRDRRGARALMARSMSETGKAAPLHQRPDR